MIRLKDKQQAIAVLKYLRGPWNQELIMKELNRIESIITDRKPTICYILTQIFCERDTLIPFLVALSLAVLQQLSGGGVVASYTANIFEQAGATNPDLMSFYVAGLGFLISSILSAVLVEVIGRKILLAVSAAGMCISHAMLGIHFYLTRPSLCVNLNSSSTANLNSTSIAEAEDTAEAEDDVNLKQQCNLHLFPLVIVSVFLYTLSFGTGFGTVTWILISEYLPLQVRAMASGIIISANRITGVFITGTFLSYSEWAGAWVAWWTLCFFCLVGFIFIILFVVETKGKELEEIPELFKAKFKAPWVCRISHYP